MSILNTIFGDGWLYNRDGGANTQINDRLSKLETLYDHFFADKLPIIQNHRHPITADSGTLPEFGTYNDPQAGINKAQELSTFLLKEYNLLGLGSVNESLIDLAVKIADKQNEIYKFNNAAEERTAEYAFNACKLVIEAHFDATQAKRNPDKIFELAKEKLEAALAEREGFLSKITGERDKMDDVLGEVTRRLSLRIKYPINILQTTYAKEEVTVHAVLISSEPEVNFAKLDEAVRTLNELSGSNVALSKGNVQENNLDIQLHISTNDMVKLDELIYPKVHTHPDFSPFDYMGEIIKEISKAIGVTISHGNMNGRNGIAADLTIPNEEENIPAIRELLKEMEQRTGQLGKPGTGIDVKLHTFDGGFTQLVFPEWDSELAETYAKAVHNYNLEKLGPSQFAAPKGAVVTSEATPAVEATKG